MLTPWVVLSALSLLFVIVRSLRLSLIAAAFESFREVLLARLSAHRMPAEGLLVLMPPKVPCPTSRPARSEWSQADSGLIPSPSAVRVSTCPVRWQILRLLILAKTVSGL
jgi:hypothetical protein